MSKTTFVDLALNEIKTKHEALQEETNKNILVAKSNKEFNSLNLKKRELLFELGKLEVNSNEYKKIVEELKKVTNEQEKVLKSLNLTFEDLKEKYNCNKCLDKGIVNGKYCSCLNKELSNILLKECGINKKDLPKFSDVDYSLYGDSYVKNIKLIFNNIEHYINNIKNEDKHIVTISGPTGVGKTFLTECTIERAIDNGLYTIYTTSIGLDSELMKYHIANIDEKLKIIEPYLTCDLLIIDDLGTEPIYNNVTIEYLYLIFSERLKANLNTFVNTNLTPSQIIDTYGERIFSRIANINTCMLIDMTANDIRLGLRK